MSRLECSIPGLALEPWTAAHRAGLVQIADDPWVAATMSADFPSPYTGEDADGWIASNARHEPALNFAVTYPGQVAGGVGAAPYSGHLQGVAEIGWWVGHP